jgi:hypothetical protein
MLAFADPDLDDGPRTDRSATARMCAVTREVKAVGELIRFVVSPAGEVIPDLKRKLPGRLDLGVTAGGCGGGPASPVWQGFQARRARRADACH